MATRKPTVPKKRDPYSLGREHGANVRDEPGGDSLDEEDFDADLVDQWTDAMAKDATKAHGEGHPDFHKGYKEAAMEALERHRLGDADPEDRELPGYDGHGRWDGVKATNEKGRKPRVPRKLAQGGKLSDEDEEDIKSFSANLTEGYDDFAGSGSKPFEDSEDGLKSTSTATRTSGARASVGKLFDGYDDLTAMANGGKAKDPEEEKWHREQAQVRHEAFLRARENADLEDDPERRASWLKDAERHDAAHKHHRSKYASGGAVDASGESMRLPKGAPEPRDDDARYPGESDRSYENRMQALTAKHVAWMDEMRKNAPKKRRR